MMGLPSKPAVQVDDTLEREMRRLENAVLMTSDEALVRVFGGTQTRWQSRKQSISNRRHVELPEEKPRPKDWPPEVA